MDAPTNLCILSLGKYVDKYPISGINLYLLFRVAVTPLLLTISTSSPRESILMFELCITTTNSGLHRVATELGLRK